MRMWQRFRPVFGLQVFATVVATLLCAWLAGVHGAVSAALGGAVSLVSGLAYVALASKSRATSVAEALYRVLRAEAVKVALMLVLLLTVFVVYRNVIAAALIGTFIVNVALFTLAVFVGDR